VNGGLVLSRVSGSLPSKQLTGQHRVGGVCSSLLTSSRCHSKKLIGVKMIIWETSDKMFNGILRRSQVG